MHSHHQNELKLVFKVTPTVNGFPDEDYMLDSVCDDVLGDVPRSTFQKGVHGDDEGLEQNDDGTATFRIHFSEFEPNDAPLDTVTLLFRDYMENDAGVVADAKLVDVEPANVGLLSTGRL